MKKMNKKGFTLMEMLIVIAIIAILIAIAIPTFTAALEKSRQKTDLANARALKSLVVAQYMAQDEKDNPNVYNLIGGVADNATIKFYLNKNGQELIAPSSSTGDPSSTNAMTITAKWDTANKTADSTYICCTFDNTCKMISSSPILTSAS